MRLFLKTRKTKVEVSGDAPEVAKVLQDAIRALGPPLVFGANRLCEALERLADIIEKDNT